MGDNASLDDFLGGESSGESDDAESTDDGARADTRATATDDTEPAAATDADSTDDTEPARTTYAWDGAGAACGACEETVERRWQQDGDLVCTDCKDWERA